MRLGVLIHPNVIIKHSARCWDKVPSKRQIFVPRENFPLLVSIRISIQVVIFRYMIIVVDDNCGREICKDSGDVHVVK